MGNTKHIVNIHGYLYKASLEPLQSSVVTPAELAIYVAWIYGPYVAINPTKPSDIVDAWAGDNVYEILQQEYPDVDGYDPMWDMLGVCCTEVHLAMYKAGVTDNIYDVYRINNYLIGVCCEN